MDNNNEFVRYRTLGGGVWLRCSLSRKVVGSNPMDIKNLTMLRVDAVQDGCDPQVILIT